MSCTGSCCVAFSLNMSPDQLLASGVRLAEADPAWALEAFTVLGMIEPLTCEEAEERTARLIGETRPLDTDRSYYKCRHWDEETRLCGIYENGSWRQRPWMCRSYPNNGICDHGCDCKGRIGRLYTRHCLGVIEAERDKCRSKHAARARA